jgi:hypothetical protein
LHFYYARVRVRTRRIRAIEVEAPGRQAPTLESRSRGGAYPHTSLLRVRVRARSPLCQAPAHYATRSRPDHVDRRVVGTWVVARARNSARGTPWACS